jgi:hypothetical protein
VAAARRICVDTVGVSTKIRAAMQQFLNFKIVRCVGLREFGFAKRTFEFKSIRAAVHGYC